MSTLAEWHPIDDFYCLLTDLLGAKLALNALREAIDKIELRTARYPAFGLGVRSNRVTMCAPEWWRGRQLRLLGDMLIWTEPDGVTQDYEWQIVVAGEDASRLWPSLAAQGARTRDEPSTQASSQIDAEDAAAAHLASLFGQDQDITRDNAFRACEKWKLSKRAFQARVWPAARKQAGLSQKARAGAKKKS